MTSSPQRTWLITGVSTGIGRALAEEVLRTGDRVVGTLRNAAALAAFEALSPGRAHGRMLDISDHDRIPAAIAEIEAAVGPIDILVNNAGYLCEGALEEATMDDIRRQLDTNLLGTVAVTKAVLPFMRGRRRGHIMIMSSALGHLTLAGIGLYSMSKFALQGFSEALAQEVKDFGIHVTVVAPGSYRSEAIAGSMKKVVRSIPDYDTTVAPQLVARASRAGNERGDPNKLGVALIAIANAPEPPVNFIVGPDAVGALRGKFQRMEAEIARWEHLSVTTDFT